MYILLSTRGGAYH